ncbi:hypothetical protein G7Y89_g13688 [Cudoniella acicularis]|uniref:Protein kinase domain-containing protein n=1 Tax=Cudoniella acicularis TaxID=354080 RepID=A0A8H4R8T6_9HELO|nr:hypothetical protein G7Y89_g13688 [Cudoniella acicularis]
MSSAKDIDPDAAQLAALGHKSKLNRNFSPLAMLGLAFAILNSWTALSASLSLALPSGGPASVLWGLIIISITLLACASPEYSSAKFVFTQFLNETGWPDGIAWLLGLLQAGLGLTGFDAVAHMIEEIPNPAVEGPKIMIACVLIGVFTGFIFLLVLLFVAGPIDGPDGVILSSAGPLLKIFYNATSNKAGAICLLIFPLVCLLFATTTIMTTSTRMTYAFARDGGLPFSRVFAKVHPALELPLNALYLTVALVVIFGCIFLGSSSAFNAIISASVVALGVSYGIPIAINCIRGRKMLPASRPFRIPSLLGWIANLIGLAYVILTTVLFLFPPDLPVTGSNMNYCVVVFFIILVISIVQWFVDGRKNFTGPRVNIENLANGEVVGMDPVLTSEEASGTKPFVQISSSLKPKDMTSLSWPTFTSTVDGQAPRPLLCTALDFLVAITAAGISIYDSWTLQIHKLGHLSLGSGGFAIVHQGRTSKGEIVAVEQSRLRTESRGKQNVQAFERELYQLCLELRILNHGYLRGHPNIIKVLGICLDEDGGQPYLSFIFEYSSYGTLKSFLIEHHDTFPDKILVDFMLQVSRGITALHQLRICHGDVKTQNALIFQSDDS